MENRFLRSALGLIVGMLNDIKWKVEWLMTDVQEVTAALEKLKSDLEAKAAEAKAEFEKLEGEIQNPAQLEGLKQSIEGIDETVKAAAVPTS